MPRSSRKTQENWKTPQNWKATLGEVGSVHLCHPPSLCPFAQPVAKAGVVPATYVGHGWSAVGAWSTLHRQHHPWVSAAVADGCLARLACMGAVCQVLHWSSPKCCREKCQACPQCNVPQQLGLLVSHTSPPQAHCMGIWATTQP